MLLQKARVRNSSDKLRLAFDLYAGKIARLLFGFRMTQLLRLDGDLILTGGERGTPSPWGGSVPGASRRGRLGPAKTISGRNERGVRP